MGAGAGADAAPAGGAALEASAGAASGAGGLGTSGVATLPAGASMAAGGGEAVWSGVVSEVFAVGAGGSVAEAELAGSGAGAPWRGRSPPLGNRKAAPIPIAAAPIAAAMSAPRPRRGGSADGARSGAFAGRWAETATVAA
jgi:hypothetical protein